MDWEIDILLARALALRSKPQDIDRARGLFTQTCRESKGKSIDWCVYQYGWTEFERGQPSNSGKTHPDPKSLAREILETGVAQIRDDIYLQAIQIAYDREDSAELIERLNADLETTTQRPYLHAVLRLFRAQKLIDAGRQIARTDRERARQNLRDAYSDGQSVRRWSAAQLKNDASRGHFESRAIVRQAAALSNLVALGYLDRSLAWSRIEHDLTTAIDWLVQDDSASRDELSAAGFFWQDFTGRPHPSLAQ